MRRYRLEIFAARHVDVDAEDDAAADALVGSKLAQLTDAHKLAASYTLRSLDDPTASVGKEALTRWCKNRQRADRIAQAYDTWLADRRNSLHDLDKLFLGAAPRSHP